MTIKSHSRWDKGVVWIYEYSPSKQQDLISDKWLNYRMASKKIFCNHNSHWTFWLLRCNFGIHIVISFHILGADLAWSCFDLLAKYVHCVQILFSTVEHLKILHVSWAQLNKIGQLSSRSNWDTLARQSQGDTGSSRVIRQWENETYQPTTVLIILLKWCDIEWFALETNRDHSVVFETASK